MSNWLTSLLIGFLGLDTTVAFQVLISQPLFSCTILGWLYGDLALGIETGLMMQLLWLNIIPAGATVFPEGNIGSMITGAIVLQYQELEIPNLVFTAGFVIGILVSFVGAYVTVIDRKLNGYILELTLQAVRKGRFSKITWLDMLSILIYFLLMSLLAFIALTLAGWAMPWLQSALGVFESNLRLVKPAVWGLGIALTLPMIYRALWPGR
ncbi:MAG: PTS sugar transporter subunit IIC [Calditrichaeota bacterium]|nr:PTS sugar transporter subunit IIC [Calditrichota bacterium]